LIKKNKGHLRLFGYGSLCWNPGKVKVLYQNPALLERLGQRLDTSIAGHNAVPIIDYSISLILLNLFGT